MRHVFLCAFLLFSFIGFSKSDQKNYKSNFSNPSFDFFDQRIPHNFRAIDLRRLRIIGPDDAIPFLIPEEIDFPQIGFEPHHSKVNRIISDSRGYIYFTGYSQLEENSPKIMTVWKLKPNGGIDRSFGDRGRFLCPYIEDDPRMISSEGLSLDIDDENNIYISGYIEILRNNNNSIKNASVWKLNSRGELDENFSDNITPGLFHLDQGNSKGTDIEINENSIFVVGNISIFSDHPNFGTIITDQDLLVFNLNVNGELDLNFSNNGFFRGDLLPNLGHDIVLTSGLWLDFDDQNRLLISGDLSFKDYNEAFPFVIQGFHTRFLRNGDIDLAYGPDGNGNINLQQSKPYQIWDPIIQDTLIFAEGIIRLNNQGRVFEFNNLNPGNLDGIPFMIQNHLYKIGNLFLENVDNQLERSTNLSLSKYNRRGIPQNNFNQNSHYYEFDTGYAERPRSVTLDPSNHIWVAGRYYPETENIPLRNSGTIGVWKISAPNYDEAQLIFIDREIE